ncbi:hypothetical protein ACRAWF_15650 [Streptomyces sp. L7]
MATYWFTGRPVDQLFTQIFRSGSSYNETAWSDKEFDTVLDQAHAPNSTTPNGANCTARHRRW